MKSQVFTFQKLLYSEKLLFSTTVNTPEGFFVFGGFRKTPFYTPEAIMFFDYKKLEWKTIFARGMERPARNTVLMSACFDGDQTIYLFGGADFGASSTSIIDDDDAKSKNFLNNTYDVLYSFDIKKHTFQKIETNGYQPQGRCGASLVMYENELILFGGCRGNHISNVKEVYDDMWMFSLSEEEWIMLRPKNKGPFEGNLTYHSCEVVGKFMYVFGGYAHEKYKKNELGMSFPYNRFKVSDELWRFNLEKMMWKKIVPYNKFVIPTPKMLHSCVKVGDYLVFAFGIAGFKPIKRKRSLYMFNLKTNCWKKLYKLKKNDYYKGFMHLKYIDFEWAMLGNGFVYNPYQKCFMVFGGLRTQMFCLSVADKQLNKSIIKVSKEVKLRESFFMSYRKKVKY